MLVVRNAVPQDLDAIHALAQGAGPGMTTFKPDRAALAQRLSVAAASFGAGLPRAQADYLFVLEDLAVGRVCGVAAIKAAVGVAEPFYNYRISTSVHANEAAGRVHHAQSLHLTHDLSGASELCSLYLHPDYRKGANGRLLSKARLLFVAQFADLFAPTIFAEMRGVQDALGRSPFWESVGRPFFQMDFHEADDLCGQGDRLFIEQLVPRLPLYTHLLTDAARAAIGQTHADTAPARRLLEQEGLHFDGYVDIFDGGPVFAGQGARPARAAREPAADSPGMARRSAPRHRWWRPRPGSAFAPSSPLWMRRSPMYMPTRRPTYRPTYRPIRRPIRRPHGCTCRRQRATRSTATRVQWCACWPWPLASRDARPWTNAQRRQHGSGWRAASGASPIPNWARSSSAHRAVNCGRSTANSSRCRTAAWAANAAPARRSARWPPSRPSLPRSRKPNDGLHRRQVDRRSRAGGNPMTACTAAAKSTVVPAQAGTQ